MTLINKTSIAIMFARTKPKIISVPKMKVVKILICHLIV